MALLVPIRVTIDQAVDTSSTECSSCHTLAFSTSPGTSDFAAAKCLNGTGYYGCFGGLLPLLRLAASTATTARPRVVTAASTVVVTVVIATVTVIAAVVATSVS